ncbi:aminotransferase class I/II-fold pyridoxal phosphate-dependent enzyme [Microbacterium esteraromaticum]|uniref:aminotransferase class I/II-fold pyridoxal phosphate-dependent enzyme n=1 Tax=Microbacterium esteraromaticum TaxID=57043 RepID=UPI001C949657|nr:PLP-dependent aminotransferase family protein [Microbacterium esteraromaticum]MBY6062410.1 PLP-dependent aminotransferase family protein [Microbacterium esteraromaticum]
MTGNGAMPAWARRDVFPDVTPRGIASSIATSIRDDVIAPDEALPTVRDLAAELRVSPSTISAAWGLLKRRGLIAGTGKSGVRVTSASGQVRRLELMSTVPGTRDLRLLHPDVSLLPALDQALIGAAQQPNLNEYYDSPILPELETAIAPTWPVRSHRFAVANGGADAIWAVLHAHSVPGDRVVVEMPTQPQLISLMVDLGLSIVPVPYGPDGLDERALRDALQTLPAAVFLQPRSQAPTGRSMTRENRDRIVSHMSGRHQPLVIEYDDLGPLSRREYWSTAELRPAHTVVIRSYEKSYGPDLRLAVIGGPDEVIQRAHAEIRLTRQWTSRILQSALLWMLRDGATEQQVQRARAEYGARLDAFTEALRARGVDVDSDDGFCAWVQVNDEGRTIEALALQGVVALRGESSWSAPNPPHVRIATSRLPVEDAAAIADALVRTGEVTR